jgi:hypothetical protein
MDFMFKYLMKKIDVRKEEIWSNNRQLRLQQEKFERIISFAKSVLEESSENPNIFSQFDSKGNEHPILDVIRLIGKNIQTKYLSSLLYFQDETDLPSLFPEELFFESKDVLAFPDQTFSDLIIEQKNSKEIYLNKDLVLPWSWKRGRLVSTISNIGYKRRWGEWKQDKYNHHVELWLPLGIGWVYGGNHSIASGILQGSGSLIPYRTYDISPVYDFVYTDGKYYYRKADNTIICPVKNVEFASIFEIGRLMKEYCISF